MLATNKSNHKIVLITIRIGKVGSLVAGQETRYVQLGPPNSTLRPKTRREHIIPAPETCPQSRSPAHTLLYLKNCIHAPT